MEYNKRTIGAPAKPILAALGDDRRAIEMRFWGYTESRPNGCIEWTGWVNAAGYGRFDAAGEGFFAHRVAYAFGNDVDPDVNLCVCHSCDNRRCVNPKHLWLGSIRDNLRDMYLKGRANLTKRALGEELPQSKLTLAQAVQALTDTRPSAVLAREFGVRGAQISAIRNGKAWVRALANVGLSAGSHRSLVA